jgi:hypothetical protein
MMAQVRAAGGKEWSDPDMAKLVTWMQKRE